MSRVAITGAAGQLGRQLVAAFERAGDDVLALSHADLDIADPGARLMGRQAPDVIVNAAAWTDVDGCARDPSRAMRVNGHAPGSLARLASSIGALIVQVSTNEVFDGRAQRPYRPSDVTNPINAYGASKLAGEHAVREATSDHLVVRTAWLFGPGGSNFVTKVLAAADRARASDSPLRLVEDEVGNPTWAPDLAAAIVALVAGGERGTVHAAGTPAASRLDWARVALDAAGVVVPIQPVPLASFERASTPPSRAVLEPSASVPELAWEPATRSYAADVARAARPVRA